MKITQYFILGIIILLLAGCGIPNEKSVSEDYFKKYPKRIVLSAHPGEGDSDNLYFHIKYKMKGTEITKSDIWLYQRDQEGTWNVSRR